MNDDALAAVLAAAQLLVARSAARRPAEPVARWALAARMRLNGAGQARLAARAPSRWMLTGRLNG